MNKELTNEQRKTFLKAQMGELKAVYLYERLASTVRDEKDRKAFLRLADDEQRHADFFKNYTKTELPKKKLKGIIVVLLYKLLGKNKLYNMIGEGEYKAADVYQHLVPEFPELEQLVQDEIHHGDAVKGLLG